ncbi:MULTISPECIES: hypothetical protein [Aeromonas]|uniref:hypothetical protein n=1 Tax=Aeromonas TaxID=642 RepID=UPI0010727620|nr:MULTISPECIES: hypothetical protein [Aeromonas]WGY73796.1 hypothetical protein MLL77_10980 [Aeromonas caviae]
MEKTNLVASLVAGLLLSGCTGTALVPDVNPEFKQQMEGKMIGEATGDPSMWGQTEESIAKKIVPKKSTKDDVKRIFGSTTKVALTDTGETWTYESQVITIFSGASNTKNTLIVLFDTDGVVNRYSMNVKEYK